MLFRKLDLFVTLMTYISCTGEQKKNASDAEKRRHPNLGTESESILTESCSNSLHSCGNCSKRPENDSRSTMLYANTEKQLIFHNDDSSLNSCTTQKDLLLDDAPPSTELSKDKEINCTDNPSPEIDDDGNKISDICLSDEQTVVPVLEQSLAAHNAIERDAPLFPVIEYLENQNILFEQTLNSIKRESIFPFAKTVLKGYNFSDAIDSIIKDTLYKGINNRHKYKHYYHYMVNINKLLANIFNITNMLANENINNLKIPTAELNLVNRRLEERMLSLFCAEMGEVLRLTKEIENIIGAKYANFQSTASVFLSKNLYEEYSCVRNDKYYSSHQARASEPQEENHENQTESERMLEWNKTAKEEIYNRVLDRALYEINLEMDQEMKKQDISSICQNETNSNNHLSEINPNILNQNQGDKAEELNEFNEMETEDVETARLKTCEKEKEAEKYAAQLRAMIKNSKKVALSQGENTTEGFIANTSDEAMQRYLWRKLVKICSDVDNLAVICASQLHDLRLSHENQKQKIEKLQLINKSLPEIGIDDEDIIMYEVKIILASRENSKLKEDLDDIDALLLKFTRFRDEIIYMYDEDGIDDDFETPYQEYLSDANEILKALDAARGDSFNVENEIKELSDSMPSVVPQWWSNFLD
ncbi:hypothetical protein ENBRE01_2201 [Enteropsectra breve]|nr:hypothetical protein ENBRE01_2201 [Enteropsectra breve]